MRTDRHARHRRSPIDPRRRPTEGFRALSTARFNRMVDDAISSLPPGLLAYLDNVVVLVEDVPPAEPMGPGSDDELLLGLYVGVPQTERPWGAPLLPDRISMYRKPIEARARSRQELAMIVQETVVHEIAHHFGIDDDRLHELGWD